MSGSRVVGLFLGFVLTSLLPLTGCNDDTTSPGNRALSALWPNEDGRRWEYTLNGRGWESQIPDSGYVFPDSQVPPAPDFSEIIPLIDNPALPETYSSLTTTWAMEFRGMITTDPLYTAAPGVTAQNLLESEAGVENPFDCVAEPNPFLVYLAAARPDLRSRLGTASVRAMEMMAPSVEPDTEHLLIHGGPWERTASYIGTYGCLDTQPAWKFLESDNTPGSQFTFRLVPQLAPDVYLHARVRRTVTVDTPQGRVRNALDVVYIIDYGQSTVTGPGSPDPSGMIRYISFGNVIYAPNIGPVSSYERNLVPVGYGELGMGVGEVELELETVSPGD